MPFLLFEGVSEKCLQGQFLCTAVTAPLLQGLNNHSFPVRGVLVTQPPISRVTGREGSPPWAPVGTALEFQAILCRLQLLKYGLPYTGHHSTRNQRRREEKFMVFFTQNNPGIGKSSSLTSKISKIPLTPMFSG